MRIFSPIPHAATSSVAVLHGGWSAEREVSLHSGRQVIQALRECNYDVWPMDPHEMDFATYPWTAIDVVFNAMHGPIGEDGTLQTLLEARGVPYTGSGAEASRLAMSKLASKPVFESSGVPTPDYAAITTDTPMDERRAKAEHLVYPVVVKPDCQGSSVGVTIVRSETELSGAIQSAMQFDSNVVIERYVRGRELTVAVLDAEPLPPIEVLPSRGFYDYRAKYHDTSTRYCLDTGLPGSVLRRLAKYAVDAVEVLGCTGLCRVDFRLDERRRPWTLEVNTIPGLTSTSLAPKAAAAAGIDFATLCQRMLEDCQRRSIRRAA